MARKGRMKLALHLSACSILLLCTVCASVATRASVLHQGERCKNLKDGFYADGCSPHYYGCANNHTYHMRCPVGLYYDSQSGRCEYRAQVSACNKPKEVQENEAASAPEAVFSCLGREDDSYAVGPCSGTYVVCMMSKPTSHQCAFGLIYNPYEKRCANMGGVPSCNPLPEDAKKELESGTLGQMCVGRPDEVVALRCSSTYYICSHGLSNRFECPKGTVYDINKSICNYKEQVYSCMSSQGGVAAIPKETSIAPLALAVTAKVPLVCQNGTRHAKGPCESEYVECLNGKLVERVCVGDYIFDPESKICVSFPTGCSDLLDDHIFDGLPYTCEPGDVIQHGQCTPTYFECTEMKKFALFKCSGDYLFDPSFKECRSKSLILDCTEGVEELSGFENQVPVESVVKNIAAPNPVIQSSDFVDDSFDLPFNHAISDASAKRDSVYVDPSPYTSNFGSNAPVLSNWPQFPRAGSVSVSQVSNNEADWSSHNNIARVKRSVDIAATDDSGAYERLLTTTLHCSSLRDGDYGLPGCRADYVTCTNGRAIMRNCPSGLFYNPSEQKCDYVHNVLVCMRVESGFPRVDDAPERSLLLALSTVTVNASGVPKAILTVGCERDEIFGLGCSPYFIICIHGIPYTMQCPETSFFDEEKSACAYRRDVKTCKEGAEVESTTVAPVSSTVSPKPTPLSSTASPRPKPKKVPLSDKVAAILLSDDDFDCSAMDNGHYGQKCDVKYTTCAEKKGSISYCAEGFAFDLTVLRCVPRKHCGKMDKPLVEAALRKKESMKQVCERRRNETGRQEPCRRDYVVCKWGQLKPMRCDVGKVFSASKKCCVDFEDCSVEEESKTENTITDSSFCFLKVDGMYRHPRNCSRVIQCFKGEGFEHTPCPTNLAFNEIGGVCDYAKNVPGCYQNHENYRGLRDEDICKNKEHGAFVTYQSCSSLYYRCLWGKPVQMSCPEDTVFNPDWSVCDYRSNVKLC